ncbi:MAG: hypothetical protein KGI97_03215 [Alphaproteobacteria bacterium]|nr:hypothetical protein [Alphaproteobacteria bacterium]
MRQHIPHPKSIKEVMVKPARKITKKAALKSGLLSTLPWNCTSFGEESEIEAHAEAEGRWVTIADVHPFMEFDGEEIASFILRAVNNHEKTQSLLPKIRSVLDLCQKNKALPPAVKKEIDTALGAISEMMDAGAEGEEA